MSFKAVVAFCIGIVIQLSQVQALLVTGGPESPAGGTCAANCCDALDRCPCVSESDSKQTPSPLLPAAVDLKLLAPKASGLDSLVAPASPRIKASVSLSTRSETRIGYAGVPLSVAFCTFVI